MYSREIVERETLKYFKGNTMQKNVWIDKYCLKDKNGALLEITPDDMHRRIAREVARIEATYPDAMSEETIYNYLKDFKYIIPGGSNLYGIGNNHSISSLGNCFVIGNTADSYGGIMHTDQEQVQLMKRRGGVGHDLSHLRHKLSPVSNSAGSSTGAVSFMPRYSNTTREVAQDGRRGALMLSLDINHPDAGEFIESKADLTKNTGANISVKINDSFMESIFTKESKSLQNKLLWHKLIHQAWKSAEPGVLFSDTIHRESPAAPYEGWKEVSTNPCGEIPLCPYDSCRLLSVVLPSFVVNPFKKDAYFDWESFRKAVYAAQKMMDDIVDLEQEKIMAIVRKILDDPEEDEIKQVEKNLWMKILQKLNDGRRTGLSGIGLADVFAKMGLRYDSIQAQELGETIYKVLAIEAYTASVDMAESRGAFPIYDASKNIQSTFLTRIFNQLSEETKLKFMKFGRRNIALLTIPPTGTIGLMGSISSGIEPVFMPVHKRRRKVHEDNPNKSFQDKNGDWWEEYFVRHPGLEEYISQLEEHQTFIPENTPYTGSSSMEINPLNKIRMVGRIQKWVDHAISQTVNLPETATEIDVEMIYLEAWKNGLKGITVYRDKCRDGVLIADNGVKKEEFAQHNAPKRPRKLRCDIYLFKKQHYLVLVGIYDSLPYEIFAFNFEGHIEAEKGFIRKAGSGKYDLLDEKGNLLIPNITSNMNQLEEDKTRLVSWGLRHGAGLKFAVEQMSKSKNIDIASFTSLVARVLKRYIKNGETSTEKCPNCQGKIIYQDGCKSCADCGEYSKCG
jgi:ribonucleoside-diphosphate reductase alpha chain